MARAYYRKLVIYKIDEALDRLRIPSRYIEEAKQWARRCFQHAPELDLQKPAEDMPDTGLTSELPTPRSTAGLLHHFNSQLLSQDLQNYIYAVIKTSIADPG